MSNGRPWLKQPAYTVLEHTSTVLQGNPLGDPITRQVIVYLPPNYTETTKHYPAIWYLPPLTSWGMKMLNVSPWDENLLQRADRLIRDGDMPPVIIAIPDCFTLLGGSQYRNSPAVGRYRDYLLTELIPLIDSTFRTIPQADHRGVVGYSSGGYAAISIALEDPGYFGAAASHSGDMGFEHCYRPDLPGALRGLEQYGGFNAFMDTLPDGPSPKPGWFEALNIIAMSACYGDSETIELPFELHTGELKRKVWKSWLQYDPVVQAEKHHDNFKQLSALYFDCGDQDEFYLNLGARQLSRILTEHGIDHTYQEFSGTHRNITHRYDISLPLIAQAIQP